MASYTDEKEKNLFNEVYSHFADRYKGLSRQGTIISYKGEPFMNTDGYNLLYNLKRLCAALENELR